MHFKNLELNSKSLYLSYNKTSFQYMKHLKEIAQQLDQAAYKATAVDQISENTQFSLDEAYEIQALSITERLSRGEELWGYKLGFTSKAKMEQMGVHNIIWGRLTSQMHLNMDGELDLSEFIHPRVEPEIAFRISKVYQFEGRINPRSDNIMIKLLEALEVIDSRL